MKTETNRERPTCETAADARRFDGKEVRLLGRYRKRLSARKMGQPATNFLGYVSIELQGRPEELDPQAFPGAPALVALGTEPRGAEEAEHLSDRRVSVIGVLAIDPSRGQPAPLGASERPKPTLLSPHDIELAD